MGSFSTWAKNLNSVLEAQGTPMAKAMLEGDWYGQPWALSQREGPGLGTRRKLGKGLVDTQQHW